MLAKIGDLWLSQRKYTQGKTRGLIGKDYVKWNIKAIQDLPNKKI